MPALRAAVSIALLFWGALFSAQQNSAQSAESYAVYSALIPQIQEVPQPKFLIADETVSYAKTKTIFPVDPENVMTIEEFHRQLKLSNGAQQFSKIFDGQPCVLVPEAEREAYVSAMVDYRRKNENSMPVEQRLDLPRPYQLVSVSELSRDKRVELARNNGAYGVFELSAVGFSSDMTVAIIYVGFDCPLCDRKAIHVLKKTNGKWREAAEGCSYVS